MANEIVQEGERLSLLEKLAKIRKAVAVMFKDSSGYNYRYTSVTEILAKTTVYMEKYHLLLVPTFVQGTENTFLQQYKKTKVLKTGGVIDEAVNEYVFTSQMNYTWYDLDSGETFTIPWVISGSQADPSQAIGSATTYALRQFLCQFFQIAQVSEDPNEWRSKQQEEEEREGKEAARAVTEQITQFLSAYKAAHPEKEKEIVEFLKANVSVSGKPSVNYLAIKDPVAATKLKEAIEEKFKDEPAKEEPAQEKKKA